VGTAAALTMACATGLFTMTLPAGAAPVAKAGVEMASVNGVSCWSAKGCEAVGDYQKADAGFVPLADVWAGTKWVSQKIPAGGAISSFLFAVSCTGATYCVAVGQSEVSGSSLPVATPFAEQWNGTSWKALPGVQPPGTSGGYLWSVACLAKGSCLVVGDVEKTGTANSIPVAAEWNGGKWTVEKVTVPVKPHESADLEGISCVATASYCVAVGSYGTDTASTYTSYPLAEIWNGTSWSDQKLPVPAAGTGAAETEMASISCTGAGHCVGLGTYVDSSGGLAPFSVVLGSAGTKGWSDQAVPVPTGQTFLELGSDDCVSASWCMAVGTATSKGDGRTLSEIWNGQGWTVQPSMNAPGEPASYLSAVSCAAVTSCAAVGQDGAAQPGGLSRSLAERWNGTAWSISAIPQPPPS
jgi:hypothetical protein